ncbi:MAG: hypothetical protein ACPGNV_09795 [Mangrovicoccus sp.]
MSRTSALIIKGKPAVEGPRTYIVFGDMRGGTTMVAGVMRGLGVFMGEQLNEDNQESGQFNGRSLDEMRAAIDANNAQHQVWAWKFPHAADYLDQVWDRLRNPHLICVFRDAVANGRGLNRWHPVGKIQAVQQSLLRQQQNLNMISLRLCPSILVSYEKAERHKGEFLNEFASNLGIIPDHDRFDFRGFMEAESYKNIADFILE